MEKLRLTEVRTIYLLPVAVMEDSSSKPGSVPLVIERILHWPPARMHYYTRVYTQTQAAQGLLDT